MIESNRRATISAAINQPGVGIRLCPPGRIIDSTPSRQSRGRGMPGYDHSVPPGQRHLTPVHEFGARSLRVAGFEDDDDEDETLPTIPILGQRRFLRSGGR
jgi:hypothetical protein